MEASARQRYSFGPFLLDPEEKVLLRRGHPVALPPKALDTLLALVEHRGHVIEKGELLNRVWPNTFVEEATLTQNIFTLRKALGDSPDGHTYIETIPRRGYRFIAPVRLVNGGRALEEPAGFASHGVSPSISARTRPARAWTFAIAAVVLSLGLAAGWYLTRHRPGRRSSPTAGRIMLAVLPFQNLTGDPQQDFLSDGFTEEMITQLGRMDPQRLGVIARTSAMQYKRKARRSDRAGAARGLHPGGQPSPRE